MTDPTCRYCGGPVTMKIGERGRKLVTCVTPGCQAWSRLHRDHPYPEPWAAPAPTDPAPTEPANPKQPEPDRNDDSNPFAIW